MFPQSELENYKLQVALLQEKLRRSEDHRQQLEDKFENIMKKRSEHERLIRTKSRLKCQQFLQEQSERNERNKSLMRALERIDQQAAALAARSERLKILKVQYELYFSQILQFRGGSNALFNYSIYSLPPTTPTSSNLNYSVDSSSPNTKTPFVLSTANVGYYESLSEIDPYRRADTIIPEDTIVSTAATLPQQQRWEVNLKPNVKDLITASAGISSPVPHNQSPLFTDTRISIDSSRYKAKDPKVIEHSFSGNMAGASREGVDILVSDRPWSSQRSLEDNANETRGSSRSYGDIDNLQHVASSLSQRSELPRSPEHFLASNLQNQPFKLDKLRPINRDEALGKMLAKLYDDGCRKDAEGGEKSTEKSQDRCTSERKNMSVIKERIIDAMESRLTPAQITENVGDGNMSGCDDATIALNQNGRADKLVADYAPHIKKKEKLSIETIENAIYGERISPATCISERKLNLENLGQEFTENLTIEPFESSLDTLAEGETSSQDNRNYVPNEIAIGENQSQEVIDNDNYRQQLNQEYSDTKNYSDPYMKTEGQYDLQSSSDAAYESQQYQNVEENYQDSSQYEQTEQNFIQDYSLSQNSNQEQEYSQGPGQQFSQDNESYEATGGDYQNIPDIQNPQYPQTDYTENQYRNYDQPYPEQYLPTEYDQGSSGQNQIGSEQTEHVENVEYNYQQQGLNGESYDPSTKAYPEAESVDYDPNTETYSEMPYEPQAYQQDQPNYDQYHENGQVAQEGYNQQSVEYTANADNSTPYQVEPAQYEPDTFQTHTPESEGESHPENLQSFTEDSQLPLTQPAEESTLQEIVNDPDQQESVKPASILATGEKSYESSPVSVKGKKKKRVNFVEAEDSLSKVTTVGKAEQKVARSDINAKISPNTK